MPGTRFTSRIANHTAQAFRPEPYRTQYPLPDIDEAVERLLDRVDPDRQYSLVERLQRASHLYRADLARVGREA